MTSSSRLYCVCPPGYRGPLRTRFAPAGVRLQFRDRPRVSLGSKGDPFGLADWVPRLRRRHESAVLVVVPRARSARMSLPGPTIAGVPVGAVFSDAPTDLDVWLRPDRAPDQKVRGVLEGGVLAEWDDDYLVPANRLWRELQAARFPMRRWFANRLNRDDVVRRLERGPRLVCYLGHGYPQGLGGYHGVEIEHLEAGDPSATESPVRRIGAFCAWACDTVNERAGPSFGRQLIARGRADAYLGSTAAVKTPQNRALVEQAGAVFAHHRPRSLADWVRQIDDALVDDALGFASSAATSAATAWRTYRLLGDPLARLP